MEISRPYPGRRRGSGRQWENVTREWLEAEYRGADKSAQEIADSLGTTRHTVWCWLRKLGIPTRSRKARNKRHSKRMSGEGNPAWNGGTARNYQTRALRQSGRPYECEWCGHDRGLQAHHRDNNPMNGSLENLAWLCGPCNRLEAQTRALETEGRASVSFEDGRLIIAFRTKEN